MDIKICVYAIAHNEIKHLETWLDSMSEADYIVVLDTGSTDGTYEFLQKDPRVTKVEQKVIKPWRFDVARNESMKLIPDDADVLICTDQDEIFNKGWAQVLRDNWKPEFNRAFYTYAWSHNDLGEPTDIFKYDKIHNREFHWVFPVHEVLMPINEEGFKQEALDCGELVYLQHYQDFEKERSSYFDLLKLSVKENKNDSHCRMLLAREYLLREDLDNALKEYKACLEMPDIRDENKKLVLIESLGRIGDIYTEKKNFPEAIKYYHMFIEEDNTHREPYLCLGEVYNTFGWYEMARAIVEEGLKNSVQHYDWVERKDSWIAKPDDILSVSYYFLGDYKKAMEHGKIAYEHNPNDVRIMKNYICFMEHYYGGNC